MTIPRSFPDVVRQALNTADQSENPFAAEGKSARARRAQAEATVALALAVREAGISIGQGLKAVGDALARR